MRIRLLLLLIIFTSLTGLSQDFSNKGKDFWIAYPAHIDATASAMGIYITSDVNATGTITVGGNILPFTLTANNVVKKFIGPNGGGDAPNTGVYLTSQDGIAIGAAIHVISDQPVAVYAHIIRSARSAATLVLPTNVWGKNYVAPSYRNAGSSAGYGEVAVMAKLPNTTVEITPKVVSRNGARTAGTPYQITLANPGDVYQVQFGSATDISGTTINSVANVAGGCNPIAVISATTWTGMDCNNASGGDNLYQQLFPVATWGKVFLTAPYIDRPYDIVRVFVTDPTTIVKKTENGVVTTLTGLTAGGFYEYQGSNPTQLVADKAISVVQYIVSQSCKTGCANNATLQSCWADPEMIILNPVEQTINNITVFSAHQNWVPPGQSQVQRCLLNIIIKTNSTGSFTINGTLPAGTFKVIPGTAYSYLQADVTNISITNPVQTLSADSAFSAIAYGFGNVESYGYNAGTNVKDLYQQIAIVSQYGIDPTPSTCIGSPVKFKMSLPYQGDSLFWSFNGNINQAPAGNVWQVPTPAPAPNPLPADSVTVVNGKTIYWYSLPANYVFSAGGTYPINVTVYKSFSDGCGNTQDIQFDLNVSAPPTANFYWQHNGCVTQAVQFRDTTLSAKPTYQWKWDFGDPASGASNLSLLKNPTHQFSAPGIYTVSYYNINTPGCISNTITKQITVTAVPAAKFAVLGVACDGKPVTLSDSSAANGPSALVKWYWDYGDGVKDTLLNNSDRIRSYFAWGNKTATLKVENSTGCQSSLFTSPLVVHPIPVAKFTLPGGICLPADSARFFDASTIADGSQATLSYLWSFGDPASGAKNNATLKNPAHYYTSSGPFSIKLQTTSAAGCVHDSTMVLSNVYPQAVAGFTINPENCLGSNTVLTSTSTGSGNTVTNWYWDYGDGTAIVTTQNPTHVYAAAGTKNIRHWVRTDKGCTSDTITKQVIVNALPTAAFNTTGPYCVTRDISFTDVSVANSGILTSWKWDLGDGTLLNLTNANPFTHVYAATGNFPVKLTVTSDKNCVSSVLIKPVIVASQPRAGYIVPKVCLSDTYAQFNDTSSIASGTISNWAWNFGDPVSGALNTSSVQSPQHSYTLTGTYTVSLTITSNSGCTDTVSHGFFVNGSNPVANFTIANAAALCANDSVAITNTSTVFPGIITKVEIYWDNAGAPAIIEKDDFPVAGKVYKHLYANFQSPLTKNVTIRLRAYSGGVCINDKLQAITLNAAPRVQFNAMPNTCLDAAPFQVTQASEVGGVPGTFKFSGPGMSASGIFNASVAGAGTHTILYTYTSSAGSCVDTASRQITVWAPPLASFTVGAPACETKATVFTSTATTPVGNITTYTWDFGDGTPVVVKNSPAPFRHTFALAGNYNVKLFVTTSNGCVSVVKSLLVTVNPQPKPGFAIPASVCLPAAAVTFNNRSVIADGTENAFTYLWDFGDPASGNSNSSIAITPTHTYAGTGPFNVNLKVTSGNGCTENTTIVLNTIHPQPKASFSMNKPGICIRDVVGFTDQSNGIDGTVNAWNWNFGDGQTDITANPTHLYGSENTFTVSLFITNSNGCNSDTVSKPITVYPYPVANAGPDRVVLEGGSIILQPVATGNGLKYLWSPPTYLNSITSATPTVVTPLADITYTMTVTASGNCSVSDNVLVTILKAPKIPNTFTPNGDGINERWLIKYLESYPECRIQVFTRAGQKVYESKGYSDATAWDGNLNGKSLPIDTYYYILEPGSGRKAMTGYVTIIK
ncbi:MAG: PKD domain-containing protein [Ferruginibacter sp.]